MDYKIKHKFDTRKRKLVVEQLRTGYARLDEYRNKSTNTESDLTLFETSVKCMKMEGSSLGESCLKSVDHLDMNILLKAKHDDVYKDWRNVILLELETFVTGTKRFPTIITGCPVFLFFLSLLYFEQLSYIFLYFRNK